MKAMHEMAPSTARSARLLSRVYGYDEFGEFVESLPLGAAIADIGAGYSGFGKAVAQRRPDVSWFNVDPVYAYSHRTERLQRRAPSNLYYQAGDVLDLRLPVATFDRVFSSALVPHLALTSQEVALQGVHNMANLLSNDGELAVASFVNNRFQVSDDCVAYVSRVEYDAAPEASTEAIVDKMVLSPASAKRQMALNILDNALSLKWV